MGRVPHDPRPYTLEYAEQASPAFPRNAQKVARTIAEAERVCILWAMGVTQHCGARTPPPPSRNLLLATGNLHAPRHRRLSSARPQQRAGRSDSGAMPNYFPGYQKVEDPAIRASFEAAWGVTLPTTHRTRQPHDDRRHSGGQAQGDVHRRRRHHHAPTPTPTTSPSLSPKSTSWSCRTSSSPRPAASPTSFFLPHLRLEKEGTFVSTERRIQRLYQVFEPLGHPSPTGRSSSSSQSHLGAGDGTTTSLRHLDEIASSRPRSPASPTTASKATRALQWPVAADGTDEPLLYAGETTFPFPDGKASFHPLVYVPPSEEQTETYDLHVNNGRLLEHFEQGNLSYPRARHSRDHT